MSYDKTDFIASTGFAVLTPRGNVHPELLGYILQSGNFTDRVSSDSTGTAYPAISESALGRLKIALPTKMEEQIALFTFIQKEVLP